MDNTLITIHIKLWLTALKNDTSFIFKASAQANKAADYILSFDDAQNKQIA